MRRDLSAKLSHFERKRKTISRIANPYLLIVKKQNILNVHFFQFFFRDMYSATITSFKQKENLMHCIIKNFPPSSWWAYCHFGFVLSTFSILVFNIFYFVLSTFSILVFIIIGNCFGEDGLGVNPERLPVKDESSL